MNYEFKKYEKSNLVKLDILLNNEKIEALSMIMHKDNAFYK
jgi:GTP-binding protein LepA